MIRTIYAIVGHGIIYGSIKDNRLYTSEIQAKSHCPQDSDGGFTHYTVASFILLEDDIDVNRLEAAEAAAKNLRDLREIEVRKEVEDYRNAILKGEKHV